MRAVIGVEADFIALVDVGGAGDVDAGRARADVLVDGRVAGRLDGRLE